ncbi:MAG: hypothetical protein ABH967_01805 [Patescibacteria group bacterium]
MDFKTLLSLFPESNRYEFTSKKIFRRKAYVVCCCGCEMRHNGYDFVRKKGFGKAKVGKQLCPVCGKQHHEDKGFWKNLLSEWVKTATSLILTLRTSDVSWKVVSKVMGFIVPCSKDKARYLFNNKIEQFEYPQDKFLVVNYDEQHPKRGRTQKFRLTLLNYKTGVPIAEGLFDNKDEDTIEAFLRNHLDTEKELIIITDCDRRYPNIFKKIWGNKVIHQKCLLHLNKLVVSGFGKNTTLLNEYNKYLILNIFYNRKKELKFLEKLIRKQDRKSFESAKEKNEWTKKTKKKFRDYVRNLENTRRRKGKNLTQRKLFKAKEIFEELLKQKNLFPKQARDRLDMIKKNWNYFTAFYHIKGCPATNNKIENYYSTSLKTHRKKQLRTDKGIVNHMKLSALKRIEDFSKPKKTLLEIYGFIKLISS